MKIMNGIKFIGAVVGTAVCGVAAKEAGKELVKAVAELFGGEEVAEVAEEVMDVITEEIADDIEDIVID